MPLGVLSRTATSDRCRRYRGYDCHSPVTTSGTLSHLFNRPLLCAALAPKTSTLAGMHRAASRANFLEVQLSGACLRIERCPDRGSDRGGYEPGVSRGLVRSWQRTERRLHLQDIAENDWAACLSATANTPHEFFDHTGIAFEQAGRSAESSPGGRPAGIKRRRRAATRENRQRTLILLLAAAGGHGCPGGRNSPLYARANQFFLHIIANETHVLTSVSNHANIGRR
jgi:hypothetical protein